LRTRIVIISIILWFVNGCEFWQMAADFNRWLRISATELAKPNSYHPQGDGTGNTKCRTPNWSTTI
jgi:hypothetical protein